MLVRILKIMTNRAVQRYFRWSAILASIKTFSDRQYIFNDKNHKIFCITVLTSCKSYITIRPFCNILLTIWSNEGISFSISISFGAISGDFDISHYFLTKRSECIWFIGYDAWTSLRRLKMVRAGWFQPWNSREPIMTASRNVIHSLERGSHTHLDHNTEKIMKNKKTLKT